jgi:hypothetical protein
MMTVAERKLPFDCMILDTEPQEVTNPFSGESCFLQPDAIAVYDTIKGCEMIGDYKALSKGLEWFRKYFPKEYMILLD